MQKDLVHQIALTMVPGIGSVLAKNLISYCGGVDKVFSKTATFLTKAPGIGQHLAQSVVGFRDFTKAEQEAETIAKSGINAFFFLDKDYPQRLKNIPDCPILLYTKGHTNFNTEKVIGIVGTRKMTNYGREFINQLLADLKPYNPLVISGLAYGVDVHAHKECLKNDIATYGVLAHGLDKIYPAIHTHVAKEMIEKNGGLITEYVTKTPPDKENFPTRNRIVAGMVDAIIVVESALKGGSLITAELANQYNRDVMALPGNIHAPYSQGCNYLIKKNKANVIENANDLAELLNWDVKIKKNTQPQLFVELTPQEEIIVDFIRENTEVTIDQLAGNFELSSGHLAMVLLELEMKNCLITLPGKRYRLF